MGTESKRELLNDALKTWRLGFGVCSSCGDTFPTLTPHSRKKSIDTPPVCEKCLRNLTGIVAEDAAKVA